MTSKYAQVSDGKVQNIAVFETREDAIRITQAIYGENSDAVNIDYIDAKLGAVYRDGRFYNVSEDGTELEAEAIPTESQRITTVEDMQNELTLALADLIGV